MEKEPYLRWHPARPDPTGTMRGDNLDSLNYVTMERIREVALEEDINHGLAN